MGTARKNTSDPYSNFFFPRFALFTADPHTRTMSPKFEMADTESEKSQLLDGPRGCPLEGVVYGYGTYACAKHSSQLQAVVEAFVLTCKTVWRHTHVCPHTILHVRAKISTTACSWELCFAQVLAPYPYTAPSNGKLLGPSRS